MNIIVVKTDGSFYTRPDTTLKRVPADYYLPDDFSYVTALHCSYITVTKAGKAIPERFAARYFDSLGKGLLLYADGTVPYLDYSSYFFDSATPLALLSPENVRHICSELSRITRYIMVRCGDIIAFEESGGAEFSRGSEVNPYPSEDIPLSFNIL